MRHTPPFPTDAPRFGDGRFVIVSRIGQGRNGAVYRGYDLAHGEWRAFKLLSVDLASDWEAWDRFVRDGLVLARTAHPNLVRVHEVIGGRAPFLVMDLVTGGTLQRWIDRNGPMPHKMACTAALEVARGVAAIHAGGGVHGAIGPGNILITAWGVRQLSDLSASHDPAERPVDVAALGDLLRRLCGHDLPSELATIAVGCGLGGLQTAVDVADALARARPHLPEDPMGAPEPALATTGGERAIRAAALPPELARLVGDPAGVSLLADAVTQPTRHPHAPSDWVDTSTGDTMRFGASRLDGGEGSDSGALTAETSTGWSRTTWHEVRARRASPLPSAVPTETESFEPDSETLQFRAHGTDGGADAMDWADQGPEPDSVTVPRLAFGDGALDPNETTGPTTPLGRATSHAARGSDAVARLPVGAGPRLVTTPAATTEHHRVSGSVAEISDPDLEVTDRAERIDPTFNRQTPGSASSLFDLRAARAPSLPSPAPRRHTPEPPPLPAHLRGSAVEPRIAAASADPLASTPAPSAAARTPPPAAETLAPAAEAVGATAARAGGCLSMVMVPASAAFGLSLAVMALAVLLVGTAARDVAAASTAAEAGRTGLHQSLQQHAVLIDRLKTRGDERQALEAAFRRYADARDEPARTEAGLALVDAVDRVGALHEDGAEVTYRLKQLRSARQEYIRARAAWEASSDAARGRMAIGLGLAAGAPRD